MPPALRTDAPRPKTLRIWVAPCPPKSGRDEAPLAVGANTADSIKVLLAPRAILAHNAVMSAKSRRKCVDCLQVAKNPLGLTLRTARPKRLSSARIRSSVFSSAGVEFTPCCRFVSYAKSPAASGLFAFWLRVIMLRSPRCWWRWCAALQTRRLLLRGSTMCSAVKV